MQPLALTVNLSYRFGLVVSLNVTGAAHYVVMPANASLPTVVDSQALTTQAAAVLFPGNSIAASGDMNIPSPFTNYSQLVLVCLLSLLTHCPYFLHCSCAFASSMICGGIIYAFSCILAQ